MTKKITTEVAVGILLLIAVILGGLIWLDSRHEVPLNSRPSLSEKKNEAPAKESIAAIPNVLVPSSSTIPEGFIETFYQVGGVDSGYTAQYINTNDTNSQGNSAQIFLFLKIDPSGDSYAQQLNNYEDQSLREKSEVREFDYNGLHGFVFGSTAYPGNIDHTLLVKDGAYFYGISTLDGSNDKFSADDLIAIFKTFESKPVSSLAAVHKEPMDDNGQTFHPNPLNELVSTEATVGSQVVTGYVWNSEKGSPKFSSVKLPLWGILQDKDLMKRKYTVDIWDGKDFIFYIKATPQEEITFPAGGVYKFRVTGISPDYLICPGDRSRYTWALTFVSSGKFNGERIPITQDVSSQGKSCRVVH